MYTFERLIFSLLFNKVPKNPKLSQPRALPSTVVSTSLVLPPIAANGPRKLRHTAPVRLLADAQGIVFGEVVRALNGDIIIVLRLPQEVAERPLRGWRLQGFSLQDRPQRQ
jgi:hypothetical protein